MKTNRSFQAIALFGFILISILAAAPLLAQEANPTPPVIHLTPTVTLTATPTIGPTATPTGGVQPDAFEPNDTPETATPVSWGLVPATLHQGDVDYYALYLKAGQYVSLHTRSPQNLDTYLQVWQGAQLLAENDDRTPADLGGAVLFTVPADGWYTARVSLGGIAVGSYELHLGLVDPTATPSPTVTATTTTTPSPTPSPTTTPMPTTLPTAVYPATGPRPNPGGTLPIGTAVTITPTPTLTATAVLSTAILLRLLGPAQPAATPQVTTARVLIYYDANNNRQPEPGEGVANVSVLAVDGQGQRLARSFTSPQGEATFALTDALFERVVTPFVSAWSARIRPGLVNEDIILGLPAVRLPVFLPVEGVGSRE